MDQYHKGKSSDNYSILLWHRTCLSIINSGITNRLLHHSHKWLYQSNWQHTVGQPKTISITRKWRFTARRNLVTNLVTSSLSQNISTFIPQIGIYNILSINSFTTHYPRQWLLRLHGFDLQSLSTHTHTAQSDGRRERATNNSLIVKSLTNLAISHAEIDCLDPRGKTTIYNTPQKTRMTWLTLLICQITIKRTKPGKIHSWYTLPNQLHYSR